MDIDRQVAHWRDGASDDWDTAQALLGVRKWRQCLFFAHLRVLKWLLETL